jgi:hypothetical protein
VTYQAESETLKVDYWDTVAPTVVTLRCPPWGYTDQVVDLALAILDVSTDTIRPAALTRLMPRWGYTTDLNQALIPFDRA